MNTRNTTRAPTALAPLSVVVIAGALALAACAGHPYPVPAFSAPSTPRVWPSGASPSPAVTFPAKTGTTAGFKPGVDGWDFYATRDIEVTALGYFDSAADGLLNDHTVGIFDPESKRLLASVVVHSDSSLDGCFRWEPITPLSLKFGKAYTIAGDSPKPFDPEVNKPTGQSWAPEIKWLGGREGPGAKFHFPPKGERPAQWLGADFKFRPAEAASPSP